MSATAQYSSLDRMLLNAAFAGIGLQKVVADVEDTIFRAELEHIQPAPPVFVTSLPRAGTTFVLELLSKLPAVATHTYRQMPFLLCPLLWEKVSRGFRREAALSERAHGDAVMIGFDSPEAFEEAIWRAWWPNKYAGGRIALWGAADDEEEFETFFVNHMKKIIAIRHAGQPGAGRYVSKNNGNIARVRFLAKLFPQSSIVVPIRDPLAHVCSLYRQHMRFSETHAGDAFAKHYMQSIGHFDFGANLQPVDFGPEFGGPVSSTGAAAPSFWLDYWIAAFSALRAHKSSNMTFVSYEKLCTEPEATLASLLAHIGENEPGRAHQLAAAVREGEPRAPADPGLDPARLAHAREIYHSLLADG